VSGLEGMMTYGAREGKARESALLHFCGFAVCVFSGAQATQAAQPPAIDFPSPLGGQTATSTTSARRPQKGPSSSATVVRRWFQVA
jgi:hypothetical protein